MPIPATRNDTYQYFAAVLLVSLYCAVTTTFGYDTLWHIPTGSWILEHASVPDADIFSNTRHGMPWVTHEWLSEVLLAAAYELFGWAGVLLLTTVMLAAAFACLVDFLAHRESTPRGLILLLIAVWLCTIAFVARPHAIVAPVAVLWTIGLVTAAERGRTPSFWLLALMALWANLHSSFVIGLALSVLMGTDAVLQAGDKADRRALALRWGFFTLLTLFVCLITPHGIQGLLFPFTVQTQWVALQFVTEWLSPSIKTPFDPVFLWLSAIIVFAVKGHLRLSWTRLFGILALLLLALKHQRHVFILGLLSPVLLATPFCGARIVRGQGSTSHGVNGLTLRATSARASHVLALILTVMTGVAVGTSLRVAPLHPSEEILVQGAVDFVRTRGLSGRVLNSYQLGSTLIFNGIPPFIDGRADMYGDAYLRDYLTATLLAASDSPAPLFKLMETNQIEWTLFQNGDGVLAVLEMSDDWERVYEDEHAVIHKKVVPAAQKTK